MAWFTAITEVVFIITVVLALRYLNAQIGDLAQRMEINTDRIQANNAEIERHTEKLKAFSQKLQSNTARLDALLGKKP